MWDQSKAGICVRLPHWFNHLSVKVKSSPASSAYVLLLSVGVPPLSFCLRQILLCGRVSQCFSLHSWRTCIILNPVETDCTPPGVVDVAMWGQGPSSWEHGIWYVKWLVSMLRFALPRQPVKFTSYIIDVSHAVIFFLDCIIITS